MGAWIETINTNVCQVKLRNVAPHMGAWIETVTERKQQESQQVAPHMGAWIETMRVLDTAQKTMSRTPYGCVD